MKNFNHKTELKENIHQKVSIYRPINKENYIPNVQKRQIGIIDKKNNNVDHLIDRFNDIINNKNYLDTLITNCPYEEEKQIRRWYSYG